MNKRYEVGSIFDWGAYWWHIEKVNEEGHVASRAVPKCTGIPDPGARDECVDESTCMFRLGTFLACPRHHLYDILEGMKDVRW